MSNYQEKEKLQLEKLLQSRSEEHAADVAEILHKRYHKLIYYFLRMFDLTMDDRDDVFNQVFVKVLRGLPGIKHYNNLKSWIVTITKNEIFNHLNKLDRERSVYRPLADKVSRIDFNQAFSRKIGSHEQDVYNQQLVDALEDCLLSVEDMFKQPFLLRYRDNLPWKEIADMLDLNVDTARKRSDKAKTIITRLLRIRYGIS